MDTYFFTYKIPIYPSSFQKEIINEYYKILTMYWNYALDKKFSYYKENKNKNIKNLPSVPVDSFLKDRHILGTVPLNPLYYLQKKLDKTFDLFLQKKIKYPPRYKMIEEMKHITYKNYKIDDKQYSIYVNRKERYIYIRGLGKIKSSIYKKIGGIIKFARIIKDDDGRYFIYLVVVKEYEY